tara:strand:+ start:5761 stop:6063 length:303 start_codon:yes stop_codon:yes gene_type:complete
MEEENDGYTSEDNNMDIVETTISNKKKCRHNEKICSRHKQYLKETPLSPGRRNCKLCKKKRVFGYSNPRHISNPFGYLYLLPVICIECSEEMGACMWCGV